MPDKQTTVGSLIGLVVVVLIISGLIVVSAFILIGLALLKSGSNK